MSRVAGLDVEWLDADRLSANLDRGRYDVLVMPYGGAYPEIAWPAIRHFLEAGGNWVNLGGRPFTSPVVRESGRWAAQPFSLAAFKVLGFTHSFEVPASVGQEVDDRSWRHPPCQSRSPPGFAPDVVYEMDVRLANTKTFPDEDGSDGQREGREQALVVGRDQDNRAVAAPLIRIDRLAGSFSGGAWVLAPFKGSMTPGRSARWSSRPRSAPSNSRPRPALPATCRTRARRLNLALRRPAIVTPDAPALHAQLTLVAPDGRARWAR